MNTSLLGKFVAILACTVVLGLSVGGCQGEPPTPTATPESVGTFTGQELPEVVEQLEGTPIYSSSPGLAQVLPSESGAYLLIAPQDPLQALLVIEEGVTSETINERESKPVLLSGHKASIDPGAVLAYVEEHYQLELQTTPDGQVVVLRVASSADAEPDSEDEESSAVE